MEGRKMTQQKLGFRQRQVLSEMHCKGGKWPADWKITHAQRLLMESLENKGLIRPIFDTRRVIDRHTTEVVSEEVQTWELVT